ncbi:MAG TPA: pyroglutamyl-peptidase I [Gaiellaceae bacterium]|nr:pyroglutamyl-peptidase I [Gaiellaceae bacterium]
MRELATGFEPFGEHAGNPSQLLAQELGGVVLPVSYARAASALRAALDERDPDLVVCFGLAETRTAVSVERFAHNLDEASTTDNDDAPGTGREIDPAGPLALRSTLPVDELVAALRARGLPAEVSRDAGGFLCNHVFYVLMQSLKPGRCGGFVHVPPLEVLPLERLVEAARCIFETCERHTSRS